MCAAHVVLFPLSPRVSSPAAFCIHVEELETATTSANSHFPWHGKCELACIQNILECVPLISNDGKAHAQRVCVCVHRRTGDEGKQTNTHKRAQVVHYSLLCVVMVCTCTMLIQCPTAALPALPLAL